MFNEAAPRFADRVDAGQRLAAELKARSFPDPVVLALPRGGVPVGFEVARALHAPLDVLLVRKIGAPGFEELGIGAVIDGEHPEVVLNQETIAMLGVDRAYIEQERDRQLAEIERRRRVYRGDAPAVSAKGRTAIVVDDGIATGGTMLAALRALRKTGPKQLASPCQCRRQRCCLKCRARRMKSFASRHRHSLARSGRSTPISHKRRMRKS